MEPGKVEKRTVVEKERNPETKQYRKGKARHVKSKKESERLILGLRLSQKWLHFFFRSNDGVIENWGFRGTFQADNQWHTLVLAIGSHRASLTVDCRSPLEM